MKFLSKDNINMTSDILRLRYGKAYPIKEQIAKFSRSVVAKFMKIDIKLIESIEKRYFRID